MSMPACELSSNKQPQSLDELCEKATNLQIAGRLDQAAGIYREILQVEPLHAAANYCFGILLVHVKRPGDGIPYLLTALSECPQIRDYWLGCLEALLLIGKTEEAGNLLASARQNGLASAAFDDFSRRLAAHQLAATPPPATPASAQPHCAIIQQAPAPATRRAKTLSPRRQERQVEVLIIEGRSAEALALARGLTEKFPRRGYGWKALGALLAGQNDIAGALAAMHTAVRLMPQDPEALRNLGATLYKGENYREAERYLRRALEIDANSAALHNDLGVSLSDQSRMAEALTHFRRAIALSAKESTSDSDLPRSSLLLGLSYDPSVDAESLFAEHCKAGLHIEGPRPAWPRHSNNADIDRRLKVGFVSGDLWNHSVANFIEPILVQLQNRPGLELHAYGNSDLEDAVTRRLRSCVQHWRPVLRLSDQQLAQQIMDDGIDILIDLSGHTSRNRLRAFARKPAPIQASWIGYPGTTGLRAMDYYLADTHFLPPGQFEHSFTEKIAYLPAAWAFEPHANSPPVNGLPALEKGFVSFGSFNRLNKVNSYTVRLWSRVLREVPTSVLVLGGIPAEQSRQALTELFNSEGISSERVAFFPRSNMETYLALHHQVDICLDTFPYTGGTTTNHALWMGVPTLTLAGQTPASRQGAANLGHLSLEGFAASDPDDFVRKGLFWSTEIAALAEVRRGLRERWLGSPLRRPEVIASGLEAALRHMWRQWCEDLPAQSFSITASNQASQ